MGPPIWFFPEHIKRMFNPPPPLEWPSEAEALEKTPETLLETSSAEKSGDIDPGAPGEEGLRADEESFAPGEEAKSAAIVVPRVVTVEKFEDEGPHSSLEGIASLLCEFEDTPPPTIAPPLPSPAVRKELRRMARSAQAASDRESALAAWKPKEDPNIKGNALATLFVGRLPPSTTERQLANAFKEFGDIRDMRIVKDKEGKPRGYAFIEFEDEADVRVSCSGSSVLRA